MKFGSPDWAQVPCLQKRTLRTEVIGLDFYGALYLIRPCISVILNQESVNKLQEILVPLKLLAQFCVYMHMGIFLESYTISLDF